MKQPVLARGKYIMCRKTTTHPIRGGATSAAREHRSRTRQPMARKAHRMHLRPRRTIAELAIVLGAITGLASLATIRSLRSTPDRPATARAVEPPVSATDHPP